MSTTTLILKILMISTRWLAKLRVSKLYLILNDIAVKSDGVESIYFLIIICKLMTLSVNNIIIKFYEIA